MIMPIVKHIAIHESPKKLVEYILNPLKNRDMKYASGIACSTDPEYAYLDLRDTYCRWSKKQFCSSSLGSGMNDVLLCHYIQSFRPDECIPELAHKIGIQWAKRVFGSKRPLVISTHVDRAHIHNHFAISIYDKDGKRWYLNNTTLERCRKVSDKLAREYGLSVIDNRQYRPIQKYAEWLSRKNHTSWKEKIADQIDTLILDENVRSVDDLVEALKKKGYTVSYKKYLSVKPPHGRKGVRTFRLGDGYSLECLEYRIHNKNMEMSQEQVDSYEGEQREYAMCLREMQLMVYRKQENYHKATYYDLVRLSNMLCFMSENHIQGDSGFKEFLNQADEKYRAAMDRVNDIQQKISFEEKLLSESGRFLELWNKKGRTPKETQELGKYHVFIDMGLYEDGEVDNHRKRLDELKEQLLEKNEEVETLKKDRKAAADNYQVYLDLRPEYEKIMERKRTEEEKRQADIERRQRDRETEERYDREMREQNNRNRDTARKER